MNKSWFSRNITPVNCLRKSEKFSLDICTFGCYFGEISLNSTRVHCKSITIFSRSRLFRHWICFLKFSHLGYVSLQVRLLVDRDVYLFTTYFQIGQKSDIAKKKFWQEFSKNNHYYVQVDYFNGTPLGLCIMFTAYSKVYRWNFTLLYLSYEFEIRFMKITPVRRPLGFFFDYCKIPTLYLGVNMKWRLSEIYESC